MQKTPNPSLEPTRTSMPLQALISFWALRVLPARSAQLQRSASPNAASPVVCVV